MGQSHPEHSAEDHGGTGEPTASALLWMTSALLLALLSQARGEGHRLCSPQQPSVTRNNERTQTI